MDTVRAARPSARASFFSEFGIEAIGGINAPLAPRRSSSPEYVATAKRRNRKNKRRNVVSTVSTAEASTAANASITRKCASRSVRALYSLTRRTKIRKWTELISAA